MDVNTTDLVLPAGLQDFLEENALICPPIPLAIFPLLEEREENFFATDWSVVSQPLNFNEHWAGNYKVKYWLEPWHAILYKGDNSYLSKILNAGFDGVFLDVIDAFAYFETKAFSYNIHNTYAISSYF